MRLIDADTQADCVARYRVGSYPTFILLAEGREIFRCESYPGREELVRRYQSAAENLPALTEAISIGSLSGQQARIARLLAQFQAILGDGGTLAMTLDRQPVQAMEVALGEHLKLLAGPTIRMNYRLKAGVLTCRFQEPLPRARIGWGLPVEQPISAVTVSIAEVVLELPRAPDLRWRILP